MAIQAGMGNSPNNIVVKWLFLVLAILFFLIAAYLLIKYKIL